MQIVCKLFNFQFNNFHILRSYNNYLLLESELGIALHSADIRVNISTPFGLQNLPEVSLVLYIVGCGQKSQREKSFVTGISPFQLQSLKLFTSILGIFSFNW